MNPLVFVALILVAIALGLSLAKRVESWIIELASKRDSRAFAEWQRRHPIGSSHTRPWSSKRWH
jgi:hypothetical protein